jgi:hypothetical protein
MKQVHSLPLDWDSDAKALGVTRNTRLGGYLVVIGLNHRQTAFGPFRTSIVEASTAHSRLVHYFLPFTKARIQVDMPFAAFNALDNAETESMYGIERLRRLKAQFTAECKERGIDIMDVIEKRLAAIADPGDVEVFREVPTASTKTNTAIVDLQKLSTHFLMRVHKVNEIVRRIGIPVQNRESIANTMGRASASIRTASENIDMLVDEIKESLNESTL